MNRFKYLLIGFSLCAVMAIGTAGIISEGYEVIKTIIVDRTTGQEAQVESNGGLAVNIQDQTSRALDLYFIQALGAPTQLASNTVEDAYTIAVSNTANFVDGTYVGIFCPTSDCFFFAEQLGAPAGSVITLDTPVDRVFTVGDTVLPSTRQLNVDGSVTAEVFQIGPFGATTDLEIDITRIMGQMTDQTSMDDSKFGGITGGLTRGLVLRLNNGQMLTQWNIKSNGDFGLLAYDIDYSEKAPAGFYGFRFRNTYGGQSKHGVVLRIEPGETLEILVQDDLTGLDTFQVMAQGHEVTD